MGGLLPRVVWSVVTAVLVVHAVATAHPVAAQRRPSLARRARLCAAARRLKSASILVVRACGLDVRRGGVASGGRAFVRPWGGWPGSRRSTADAVAGCGRPRGGVRSGRR